jgi:predicted deacylase
VQAGVSGLEIEPAMILPNVVKELDPNVISGTLVLVPLLNTTGFCFEQVNAVWDDTDLNTLGRGRQDGRISEALVHTYYDEVISRADALIDIHTGALWGYFRYAGVYRGRSESNSLSLAIALGLPHVLLGQMEDQSMAFEAAKDGKAVVSAWIGGGPGLRDYGNEDLARTRMVVLNAMKQLGMLGGSLEGQKAQVIEQHTVIRVGGERGLTFMDKNKRGKLIKAGEEIGYVRHPYTGEILQKIVAPREGVMLHAGASWPIVPEAAILSILGKPIDTASTA